MTQPAQDHDTNPICAVIQDTIADATQLARTTITNEEDLYIALHAAAHAATTLLEAAYQFSALRAEITTQILDTEHLSLAKLAEQLGVSKARTWQISQTHRRGHRPGR